MVGMDDENESLSEEREMGIVENVVRIKLPEAVPIVSLALALGDSGTEGTVSPRELMTSPVDLMISWKPLMTPYVLYLLDSGICRQRHISREHYFSKVRYVSIVDPLYYFGEIR